MKAFKGEIERANEQNDEQAVARARQAWSTLSQQWLSTGRVEDSDLKKPRKRYRGSAEDWIHNIHNQMKQCGMDKGLDTFRVENPDSFQDVMRWPFCRLVVDQGSDGWAASWFLKSEGLNIEEVPDWSHGCHNDMKGAIRQCGLMAHELLMISAFNIAFQPFDQGMRHEQMVTAMREHMANFRPSDCNLFQVVVVCRGRGRGAQVSLQWGAQTPGLVEGVRG